VFPSSFVMGGESDASTSGVKIDTCPNCGAMAGPPDGFYEVVGDTLRIVTDWSPEERERFAAQLTQAQSAADRDAAADALNNAPGLAAVAARIVPRDPGQFWAFIACVLMLLGMFGVGASEPSASGPSVTVFSKTTVIERVMEHPAPTVPERQPLRASGDGAPARDRADAGADSPQETSGDDAVAEANGDK
jgi:hypothetical protein